MKILYVAKHGSGDNDDEGAIEFALKKLGHEVRCVNENRKGRVIINHQNTHKCDFLLFHKWNDFGALQKTLIPKVFWYFDLVDIDDPSPNVRARCRNRIQWMDNVLPVVDLGFCTDGDWVNQDTTGKLVRLTQGADERVMGMAPAKEMWKCDVLFTGLDAGSGNREKHIAKVREKYGTGFRQIPKPGTRRRYHGRQLAAAIASAKVVLAPIAPTTDHYWSNRVYNTLGFGGLLVHPHCETLLNHFTPEKELLTYRTEEESLEVIDRCLMMHPETVSEIKHAALDRVRKEHLYRHRCEVLVNTVKERLGL